MCTDADSRSSAPTSGKCPRAGKSPCGATQALLLWFGLLLGFFFRFCKEEWCSLPASQAPCSRALPSECGGTGEETEEATGLKHFFQS